jgi:hypothetical protein
LAYCPYFEKEMKIGFFAKYNKNNSSNQDEMGGACSTNGRKSNVYRIFVGKPEGKRPLGRPGSR